MVFKFKFGWSFVISLEKYCHEFEANRNLEFLVTFELDTTNLKGASSDQTKIPWGSRWSSGLTRYDRSAWSTFSTGRKVVRIHLEERSETEA